MIEQVEPDDAPNYFDTYLLMTKERLPALGLGLKTFDDEMDGLGPFVGAFVKGKSGNVYFLQDLEYNPIPGVCVECSKDGPGDQALSFKLREAMELMGLGEPALFWTNPQTGLAINLKTPGA